MNIKTFKIKYYLERKDPDYENKMHEVLLVYNNHSSHKSKETQKYLATLAEDRFVFVSTPTHASWLNMIESFFSNRLLTNVI